MISDVFNIILMGFPEDIQQFISNGRPKRGQTGRALLETHPVDEETLARGGREIFLGGRRSRISVDVSMEKDGKRIKVYTNYFQPWVVYDIFIPP